MKLKTSLAAEIPMRLLGPIKIIGSEFAASLRVPLATLEAPLWPSVARGARVSRLTDGIAVTVIKDAMTRSILLEADSASTLDAVVNDLFQERAELEKLTSQSSRFARLQDWQSQIVGNLLYLRFAFSTGDAAGHNMTTKAAEILLNWLLHRYPKLRYVSVSGNFCVDKKVSAVNSILGRGKHVVAEIFIPKAICLEQLRATPEQLVALHIKKNLIGSIVAGGVCSANAHFANMLLAFYLATGQDAANIVEGSQGVVHAEVRNKDLYFSVTLPSIIVGTAGVGKDLAFVQENLKLLDCLPTKTPGQSSRRLAIIAAATVLCGELSLLAALANRGELMRSHVKLQK
jgi:hydroxymethylglutaryl-CoA reductase (NADPH)